MNWKILSHSVLVIVLTACAATTNTGGAAPNSLYEELGGNRGLEQLVDTFIRKIAKDKQVFPYFAKTNVTHFRNGFISHICDVSGGPCEYKGDSMVDIHTGMNINQSDFNRIVELLVEAMEVEGIPYTTQNKLLAILAPMREDIIKM